MSKKRDCRFSTAVFTILPIWVIAMALSLILCECSDNNVATPRRKAFPRIITHDSTFYVMENLPIHFEISKIASITLDSASVSSSNNSRWINIYYKPYNATIYCTFTQADNASIKEVLSNRSERMALNSGGLTSELIELTNANKFYSQILITEQNKVTPIQFLSTNNQNWVISGALCIDKYKNIDSIRPVINVVKRDIIHSLKTINQ
ncbi:MAG: hypothetical protein IKV32_07035 [Muribaculaceae bacterium]|nr:hypothetical protein [Muribaculaceae bacterium]